MVADDFTTINGKQYKGATVTGVEADGIILRTKSGITKVYFVELPREVQQRFKGSAKVARAQREREQVALQTTDDEREVSSTAAEDDEALPKNIFIAVVGFVVCGTIAVIIGMKKFYAG